MFDKYKIKFVQTYTPGGKNKWVKRVIKRSEYANELFKTGAGWKDDEDAEEYIK